MDHTLLRIPGLHCQVLTAACCRPIVAPASCLVGRIEKREAFPSDCMALRMLVTNSIAFAYAQAMTALAVLILLCYSTKSDRHYMR